MTSDRRVEPYHRIQLKNEHMKLEIWNICDLILDDILFDKQRYVPLDSNFKIRFHVHHNEDTPGTLNLLETLKCPQV